MSDIPYTIRTICEVCEAKLTDPVIKLPRLPLTETYTDKKPYKPEGFFSQTFHFCRNCGHGQLGCFIQPQILYRGDTYYFRTSESKSAKTASDVFLGFIKRVINFENPVSSRYIKNSIYHRRITYHLILSSVSIC